MMNQKEAVFQTTMAVLKDKSISFDVGQNIEDVMTKEIRESIQEIICEGFRNKEIELRDTDANRDKLTDRAKLTSYVSGLVNNWFRKDKRLNGGEAYVAKNPGSRPVDKQLKALRLLKVKFHGTDKEAAIDQAIATRTAELEVSKAKQEEVDLTAVPEELKKVLGF